MGVFYGLFCVEYCIGNSVGVAGAQCCKTGLIFIFDYISDSYRLCRVENYYFCSHCKIYRSLDLFIMGDFFV